MADLFFRYGLHENLPTEKTEGTVYVTTDEKSMYVDLGGQRIRLQGAVQYYETITDFANSVKPPYAEDVLYFFRQMDGKVVNALMAYDGEKWVQINITKADYESRVGEIETKLSDAEEAITTNATNIATNTTNIATNAAAIQALNEIVGGGDTGSGNTIFDRVASLEERVDSAEGRLDAIDGEEGELTNIKSNISDLQDSTGSLTERLDAIDGEEGRMAAAESRLNTAESRLDALDGEGGRMATAEDNITEALNRLDAIDGDAGELTNIKNDIKDLQDANESIVERLDAIDGDNGELAGIKDRLTALDGEEGRMADAEGRLDTAEDDIDSIEGRLTTAEGNITAANNKITSLEEAVADRYTKTETDEIIEETKTELSDSIKSSIDAANAMTYKGTINSRADLDDKTNVSIGDTYVLAETTEDGTAGDFFIAEGTEDETTGFITGTVTWSTVRSGYSTIYDPELTVETATNTVGLENFSGTSLGKFKIQGDGKNIQVSLSDDGVFTISSVWGTF